MPHFKSDASEACAADSLYESLRRLATDVEFPQKS